MFSGIVECQSLVLSASTRGGVVEICLVKPSHFNDLSLGDSICVNGVCLTLERFDQKSMIFALAAETLQITGWNEENLLNKSVNLERSLPLGGRIHGHLVTGHVEGLGEVVSFEKKGESAFLKITFPKDLTPYFWRKGSVTINGVSLTINQVEGQSFEVCLIPETLKRTNLNELIKGSQVNLEVDVFVRGIVETSRFFMSNFMNSDFYK